MKFKVFPRLHLPLIYNFANKTDPVVFGKMLITDEDDGRR